ncbi:MAG: F-type H+-transporting ATPase subunit alpha [Parcubacteria group bacterium Gr01-1014_20]|nr:MAG: F-type H+-transporting ATPase subunit alpha [Parcubacteria group bacterium Gr01-1014_20]
MAYDIIEKLKKEIENFKHEAELENVGIIIEASDGIAKISGLSNALSQEILIIETETGDVSCLVSNLEESSIGSIILGNFEKVKIGDRVRQTGQVLSIEVGEEIIGRVVDPLGKPLDNKGVIFSAKSGPAPVGKNSENYPLEKTAPSVVDRESVRTPVHTGIKAIDSMIPIGRGQRELIIGDRGTGKTAVALDTILNQAKDAGRSQVVCVYVAIGQKNSKIAKIVKILEDAGAMKYTVIVSAPASAPAALQYLAPFAGCAIGEYFMDKGKDALVIYDDLSKHAQSYRELSLLLRRPPGREAYPGDIFYLHSRLLERAAKLSKEKGSGSLTALPIIETQLGDVSAYIPTNVISITDGQIYLESNLFNQGLRPAVNVGLSVSRVGSSAQTKAMKKVAGRLRLELAQFRELQAFVQFASDLDENTKKKIERGERLTELLKQSDREPVSFEKEVVVLYAGINGFMDDVPKNRIKEFETKFVDFLEKMHKEKIIGTIQKSNELNEETEKNLAAALKEFKKIF